MSESILGYAVVNSRGEVHEVYKLEWQAENNALGLDGEHWIIPLYTRAQRPAVSDEIIAENKRLKLELEAFKAVSIALQTQISLYEGGK